MKLLHNENNKLVDQVKGLINQCEQKDLTIAQKDNELFRHSLGKDELVKLRTQLSKKTEDNDDVILPS